MKILILVFSLTVPSFAQTVIIGAPAGPGGASSGGTIALVSANHDYTAAICATGIPDTVSFAKDGGLATECVPITGSPQALRYPLPSISTAMWSAGRTTFTTVSNHNLLEGALVTVTRASPGGYNVSALPAHVVGPTQFSVPSPSNPGRYTGGGSATAADGATITWTSTTGHGLTDRWIVSSTIDLPANTASFIQRGLGAVVRSRQAKERDALNAADYGMMCDGAGGGSAYTGTDDTAALQAAINAAESSGQTLHLPYGKCLVGNISISLVGNRSLSVEGHAPCSANVATAPNAGNPPVCATQIICTKADGSKCWSDASMSGAGNPSYHFRDFAMIGLDSSLGGNSSGTALAITNGGGGGTVTGTNLRDMYFYGFGAAGAHGLELNLSELNTIQNVRVTQSNSCYLFGSPIPGATDVNQTVAIELQCDNSTSPVGVDLEHAADFHWTGGLVQSNAGNGVLINNGIDISIKGTHFENNNKACTIPLGRECINGLGAILITSTPPETTQNVEVSENGFYGGHDRIIVDGYSFGGNASTVGVRLGMSYFNGISAPGIKLGRYTRNVEIGLLENLVGNVGVLYTGAGLNDVSAKGNYYLGTAYTRYRILLNPGLPDSFTWQNITTSGPVSAPIPITGQCQPIELGICIGFAATTGHATGNYAVLGASPYPNWLIEDYGTDNRFCFGNWCGALNSGIAANFAGPVNVQNGGANASGPRPYTTGTVTIANGSAAVTGTGTSWVSEMGSGVLVIGGAQYPIASVTNATSLRLAVPFTGASVRGAAYSLYFGSAYSVNGTRLADGLGNGYFSNLSVSGSASFGGCGLNIICLRGADSANGFFGVNNASSGQVRLSMSSTFGFVGTTTNHPLKLFANNVASVNIDPANGYLCILCALNAYPLDVNGNIHTYGNVLVDGSLTVGKTTGSSFVVSLTAGPGVSVSSTAGAVTVVNSGVTSIGGGSGLTVSSPVGNVTVTTSGFTGTRTRTVCSQILGGMPSGCSTITETYVNGLLQ